MRTPLNRTVAPQILRFFDACFKHGVMDAYEFGDDLGTKDFLEQRKDDWLFGVIEKPEETDWQMFRFTLYWWARKAGLKSLGENYIFNIRRKDAIWCFLPYCMRFYLLGIEEWLAYPNPVRLQIFKAEPKVHWDPNVGLKNFTKGDYISYLHDFAYAYRILPDDSKPVSYTAMEAFCQAMYDLTRGF